VRLHPLSALVGAVQRGVVIGSFAFFVSAMAWNVADLPVDLLFVLAPLGFVLGAGYHVAYYYRFSYELTADTFDVTSGVLGRQEREIPYRRIQNVDLTRNLLHRLLGMSVLRIETAGGASTEAELNFVDANEAARIQREVRSRRQRVTDDDATETPPVTAEDDDPSGSPGTAPAGEQAAETAGEGTAGEQLAGTAREPVEDTVTPLFALTPRELLLLAAASFRPGSVVALFFGLPFAPDLLRTLLVPILGPELLTDPVGTIQSAAGPAVLLAIVVVLVAGILLAWAVSAFFTVLGYYNFQLGRQGDDLVYERGLVQRYSGSIPVDKIQTIAIRETLPMRLFGYAGLVVETAGYSSGQESQGQQSAIPLADRKRALSFARTLEPFDDLTFTRPPKRARRRYVVRFFLVSLVVVGAITLVARFALTLFPVDLWPLYVATLVLVPVAGHYRWVHRGYHVGERHVVLRSGFWRRSIRVVPYYRLQTVFRERTIFQRRLDLSHVTADTASSSTLGTRDATAFDIDDGDAEWLFETCRERLQERVRERARG
jgi:putative membrane protein